MAPVLLPSRLIGSAAERAGAGAGAPVGGTRHRRLAAAVLALALLGAGLGLWQGLDGAGRAVAPSAPETLRLHLAGFGTPLPAALDRPPCPQGATRIDVSAADRPVGSLTECVLTVAKDRTPDGRIRSTSTTSLDTYALPGGTVVLREAQTTLFALDQRHTSTSIRGRVVGGTGRYAHARGTLAGGGPGADGRADWSVVLRLES